MSRRTTEEAAEYNRRWYLKNKDRVRRRNAQWVRDNPDKKAAQHRRRKQKDPERVRALQREKSKRWYRKNIEKARAISRESSRKRVAQYPEKKRAARLMEKYRLTPEQWEAMFEAQGRCCAICASDKPNTKAGWNTDHCHVSGKVRFILCGHCNRGLGAFKDSPAVLRRAADLLEAIKEPTETDMEDWVVPA